MQLAPLRNAPVTFEISLGIGLCSLAAKFTGLVHLLLGGFLAVIAHLLRLFGVGLDNGV